MKKSTLIFLSMLTAVFLSASDSYAYSTLAECEANCGGDYYGCSSYTSPCSSLVHVCLIEDAVGDTIGAYNGATVVESRLFASYEDCNIRRERDIESGYSARSSCYSTDGGYRYHESLIKNIADCNGNLPGSSTPICPASCSSCSSSTTCITCYSGFYLSAGSCLSCPENATCGGSSTFSCNSGYLRQGDACVSCPENATCGGSSTFGCNSGYLRQGDACVSCPENATCNGSSTFSCNSGYTKSGNSCVKERTVSSCPSRMTLSSDGCCCINK